MDSIQDIVRSRLQAALNGWKLSLGIGADLDVEVGGVTNPEFVLSVQRRENTTQWPIGTISNWHGNAVGRCTGDEIFRVNRYPLPQSLPPPRNLLTPGD